MSTIIFTIKFVLGLAQETLVRLREREGAIQVKCRVTYQAIFMLAAQKYIEPAALLALDDSLP